MNYPHELQISFNKAFGCLKFVLMRALISLRAEAELSRSHFHWKLSLLLLSSKLLISHSLRHFKVFWKLNYEAHETHFLFTKSNATNFRHSFNNFPIDFCQSYKLECPSVCRTFHSSISFSIFVPDLCIGKAVIQLYNFVAIRADALSAFGFVNRFRQICTWFVNQKWFDNVVLLFIALNCITLAMERPNIPPSSTERVFLATANYVFTVVFTVEMFIKVSLCQFN